MGCDVVVFSSSESKREEAKSLGAHEFVLTKGEDTYKAKGKPIDHLLVTTSANPDWAQ
jgi:D-arabinose 1-dehydrogenase-like Zn-dependent alcohol dehydrogenase